MTRTVKMMAGWAILFGAPAAMAQPALTAKVPFSFSVGGRTLPAGEYEFRDAAGQSGQRVFVLQGSGGRTVIVPNHRSSGGNGGPASLLFRCDFPGACSLAEIRTSGNSGWGLNPKSAAGSERVVSLYLSKPRAGE